MKNKQLILSGILLIGIWLPNIQMKAQTDTKKETAGNMHQAVIAGDLNNVMTLLAADSTLLERKDRNGNTPLNLACFDPETWNKQLMIAKFLIDKGANINTKNNRGGTPLLSISLGAGPDFDLVKLLVARGADVNGKDNFDEMPIHSAVIVDNLEVTRFLIEHGADVNAFNKTYYEYPHS